MGKQGSIMMKGLMVLALLIISGIITAMLMAPVFFLSFQMEIPIWVEWVAVMVIAVFVLGWVFTNVKSGGK